MRKIVLLLVFLANAFTLFGQTAKKEILLDENDKQISAIEFKKKISPPDYKFTYAKFENDTAVFGKLVLRKEYGVIKEQERETIINELRELSERDIRNDQIIIINFFTQESAKDKRHGIYHYAFDNKYKRYVKRTEDVAQFYITEKDFRFNKDYIFEDKNGIIGKTLFKHPFYVNYIIIKPNGHYYKQVSEYRQDEIPKIVEAEW